MITKDQAEQIYESAVTDAKKLSEENIAQAWESYLEVMASAKRICQESIDRAWREYLAVETRVTDQRDEILTQARKIYQETISQAPADPEKQGGQ